MSAISANLIKDLREQTGAGMLDCKKALEETKGDFEPLKTGFALKVSLKLLKKLLALHLKVLLLSLTLAKKLL